MRHLDILERRLKLEDAVRRRHAKSIYDDLITRLEESVLEDFDLRKPPGG